MHHVLSTLQIIDQRYNKSAGRLYAELFLPELPHVVRTCRLHADVVRTQMSSARRRHPHMSSAHVICMRTSSAHRCHPHKDIIRTCHPHMHIIHTHTCHPHIICSTPHGQCGPKLSFYSNRNWLLNAICCKNVELFHFRII